MRPTLRFLAIPSGLSLWMLLPALVGFHPCNVLAQSPAPAAVHADYPSLIAQAEALTAENSHARAADAFAAAEKVAPSDAARRFAQLGKLRALFAAGRTSGASTSSLNRELTALLEPYTQGLVPRDRLWSEAVLLSIQLQPGTDALARAVAVARYWADQVRTPDASANFQTAALTVASLAAESSVGRFFQNDPRVSAEQTAREARTLMTDALALVRDAQEVASDLNLRAELALLRARALQRFTEAYGQDSQPLREMWSTAETLARDTPFASEAALRHASQVYAWSAHAPSTDSSRRGRAEQDRVLAQIDRALALPPPPQVTPAYRQIVEQVKSARAQLTTPTYQVSVFPAFLPSSAVGFTLTGHVVTTVDVRLYRLTLDQFDLALSEQNSRTDRFRRQTLPSLSPLRQWSPATGVNDEFVSVTSWQTIATSLEPGAYVLWAHAAGTSDDTPIVRPFLVTGVQALAREIDPGHVSLYVYDQNTGNLLDDVRGILTRGEKPVNFSGLSARDPGIAWPATAESRWAPARLVGEAGGQPFAISHLGFWGPDRGSSWTFHLAADRRLYLPGQTAHWKLTVREAAQGELRTPAGRPVKITAFGPQDERLASWTLPINRWGSAFGELPLPATLRPGQVRFDFSLETGSQPARGTVAAFFVDRFQPPEIRADVKPANPLALRAARPGGEIELLVTAQYFSGEPLPGAPLRWTARFAPRYRPYDVYRPNFSPRPPQATPASYEATATTDRDGQARLRLPLPAELSEDALVSIVAQVNGSGTSAEAQYSFGLYPTGYQATLQPAEAPPPSGDSLERSFTYRRSAPLLLVVPGERRDLALYIRDGADQPVPAQGSVQINRLTWEEIWRGPHGELSGQPPDSATGHRGDPLANNPSRWERIQAGFRSETVEDIDLAVDASGVTRFALPASLTPGRYQLAYTPRETRRGRSPDNAAPPLATLPVVVADATTSHLSVDPSASPEILFAEPNPKPGRPIQGVVVLSATGRNLLLTATGATQSARTVTRVIGNVHFFEFPWQPDFAFGLRISASVLDATDDGEASATLVPSSASRIAQVTVTAQPDQLRPGQSGKLAVQVNDAQGRPLAAEVSLGVVDAAVATLGRQDDPSILQFLQPRLPPSVGTSRSEASVQIVSRSLGTSVGQTGVPDADGIVTLDRFDVAYAPSPGFRGQSNVVGDKASFSAAGAWNEGSTADTAPRVRAQFDHTAFWIPDLEVDASGHGEVSFTYPDSLTAWQIRAEVIGGDAIFGATRTDATTTLPVQARLRTPRTWVAGDTGDITGALVNATARPLSTRLDLEVTPDKLIAFAGGTQREQTLAVAPEAESLAQWSLQARAPGRAVVKLTARTDAEGDAMEVPVTILENGWLQRTGAAARADAAQPAEITLTLPEPLDPRRTRVDVQIAPGITPALVDALPYLIDYPYGCVEQTVSRFLPAVVVSGFLRESGFTAPEVQAALAASHARQAAHNGAPEKLADLEAVIASSLARLAEAQNGDGSFGWWRGGSADPYMTAYVLRGLTLARESGVVVPDALINDTYTALVRFLNPPQPVAPVRRAWILAAAVMYSQNPLAQTTAVYREVFAELYRDRASLPPAGLALLIRVAHRLGNTKEIPVLLRNLENGVVRGHSSELGATAQWGQSSGYLDGLSGPVESTALGLDALLDVDPRHPLLAPAATWLLIHRQSGRWNNTRDTALAVLALQRVARLHEEKNSTGRFTLSVNGHAIHEGTFDRRSLLTPAVLTLDPATLRPGANRLGLTRSDRAGSAYLAASAQSWARSETVKPSGSFFQLDRGFTRLTDVATVVGRTIIQPKALSEEGAAPRNERVRGRLTVTVSQDIDYVMVVAPKPAGCEPVNPLSGWDATLRRVAASNEAPSAKAPSSKISGPALVTDAPERRLYREEYADRSVFFLERLPAGTWEIDYTLRATFPGDYRALPATIEAMYVPLLTAQTGARRFKISNER